MWLNSQVLALRKGGAKKREVKEDSTKRNPMTGVLVVGEKIHRKLADTQRWKRGKKQGIAGTKQNPLSQFPKAGRTKTAE